MRDTSTAVDGNFWYEFCFCNQRVGFAGPDLEMGIWVLVFLVVESGVGFFFSTYYCCYCFDCFDDVHNCNLTRNVQLFFFSFSSQEHVAVNAFV